MTTIKTLASASLMLCLTGCAILPNWLGGGSSVTPVKIQKEEVARTPLNLDDPAPLKTRPVTWIVVTPENINRVWEELRSKKADLVLFALTDDGYEQLSVDFAQIRNLVEQQRRVILEYKNYYEPESKKDIKK